MENSGLTKEDIYNIKSVFSNYLQIEEALLYGSRAMGNYKPASDIDISLMGDEIDLS
jgi:predicted nucleotidyltransferase